NDSAATMAAVGGHQHRRLGVVHAVAQRLGGEAAEDDAVGRADARAGEHRDRRLGDHREIDADAVAGPDAERLQYVGEAADLAMERVVGEDASLARLALPD